MIGRQDLQKNGDASFANCQRSVDSVQILDSRGQKRRLILNVLEFGIATCGQFVSSWCKMIECLLLEVREPRFDDRPYGAILNLFVAYGAVTNLLYQMESRFSVNQRQSQFGLPSG